MNSSNANNNSSDAETTKVITKIILDFDDALFPSHRYKVHEILKYHESNSSEPVQTGRECFKNKEPQFMKLKKNIDLVIFKLMQRYDKDNFVILSTGDYQWIKSTLAYYEYLLSAYNIEIYSTQQWGTKHPNDFNSNCSLSAKTFLMKMLLKKWRNEAQNRYKGTKIKFRLISIGDSFFEFLGCYNIGFDYVNRIKLLEEPSVDQLIASWGTILSLCSDTVYNANVVFVDDKQYYYLDDERMQKLNQECIVRVNNTTNTVFKCSLLDVITMENTQCYEIMTDENGKQYKQLRKKETKLNKEIQNDPIKHKTDRKNSETPMYTNYNINPYIDHNFININTVYQIDYNLLVPLSSTNDVCNQHMFYAQQQQLLYAQQLFQQQQMQSQFLLDVPRISQYTDWNYADPASVVPINYPLPNTILTADYTGNT